MENFFAVLWNVIQSHTWLWLVLAVIGLLCYAKVITLENTKPRRHQLCLSLSGGLCALFWAMFVVSLSFFSHAAGWTLLVNYGFLILLAALFMYGLFTIHFMVVLGCLFLDLMDIIFFGPKVKK